MSYWFAREELVNEIGALLRSTPPERAFEMRSAAFTSAPRIARTVGSTMEIDVSGVLTRQPDRFLAMIAGNTAYVDIVASLRAAESDPAVRRVILNISSGGGSVDGLFDCLAALEMCSKPITARCDQACSAAYAIAAMAGKIEASNAASTFGSIGVATTYIVHDDEVTLTSTDAPNKRPDVKTPQGQATVRKHLDDLHGLFVEAIAKGRRTTVENVNKNFGRGGVVLAREARRLGMIDSVAPRAEPGSGASAHTPARAGSMAAEAKQLMAAVRAIKTLPSGPGLQGRIEAALSGRPSNSTTSAADFQDAVATKLRERFGMAPVAATGPGDDDDDDGGAIPLAAVHGDVGDQAVAILRERLGKV